MPRVAALLLLAASTAYAAQNWDIALAPLPALAYMGETVAVTVRIGNVSRAARHCAATLGQDGAEAQTWRLTLAAGKETTVVFTLDTSRMPVTPRAGRVTVRETDADGTPWNGAPLFDHAFILRDGRGELHELRVEGDALVAEDGTPVILMNHYENEAEYRRWAPVKYAADRWRRRAAPRAVAIQPSLLDEGEHPDFAVYSYRGDPLAALTSPPAAPSGDGATVTALAWGFDEAYARRPLPLFARALDLAVDRWRQQNPLAQIALVTPPPLVGEIAATERYAEEIRRLAREHHAELLDLHQAFLAQSDWENLFALPGDDNVFGLYPNAEGRAFIRMFLRENLP